MNFVLTGAAGNVTKPLAYHLLTTGHNVKVISRNEDHLGEIKKAGASVAIGSLEDLGLIEDAFAGADAVYTMYPPDFGVNDIRIFYGELAKNYAAAIRANGIKYVVNLSSVGANLSNGIGHISALYNAEQVLNERTNAHIKHLRPVYFYTNLFSQINMIRNAGVMGSNFSLGKNKFPLVHPGDIAAVAAEELLGLNFVGNSTRYIASDETSTDEIASMLGTSIGIPGLKWVKFTDEQTFEGLLQAGISKTTADLFVEGFRAMNGDNFWADYWKNHPSLGRVKLENFAKIFGEVYRSEGSPLAGGQKITS
jgi:uncharacterized protein YbjT (DUF2867 family)